ncbi:MAG: TIR domain-containing protein [Candidatus Shapirobacteria bacterium]|jgi:hypothetical protein
MKGKISIFFAWQSDLPNTTNRSAIKGALEKTNVKFKSKDIELYIDEATRDKSGSPNIPKTILEKINTADIFIADVSIINGSSKQKKDRKVPNPNVIFELGYAVSELGWERIILLFNKSFGDPKDLPFDFDRHRLAIYSLSEKITITDKKCLDSLVEDGVEKIVEADPLKPAQLRLTPEQKKRERDIKNLKYLLETIHIPTLQEYIGEMPYKFDLMVCDFWNEFDNIVSSNLFNIYDKDLSDVIKKIHKNWGFLMSHGEMYMYKDKAKKCILIIPHDRAQTVEEREAFRKIEISTENLEKYLKRLLIIVNKNFLEIDPHQTSQQALKNYHLFYKD